MNGHPKSTTADEKIPPINLNHAAASIALSAASIDMKVAATPLKGVRSVEKLNVDRDAYCAGKPFPHAVIDQFLPVDWANELQRDILALPDSVYNRIRTAFEDKFLLPKQHFPKSVLDLLRALETDAFLRELEKLSGRRVYRDEPGHYWGVHKFKSGDRLDVHVDAGIHPLMKKRKFMTILIYLSNDWKPEFGGDLELWKGDTAAIDEPKLDGAAVRIAPEFNRAVVFTNTDTSWHGSPSITRCEGDARRIVFTLSYMTDEDETLFANKRQRAYFAGPRTGPDPLAETRRIRAQTGSAACSIPQTTAQTNPPSMS